MSWFKHADSLSWSPGHAGKGYQLHDGTIKTWNLDPYHPVDQAEVHRRDQEVSPIALRFEIDPDGGVVTDNPGSNVDAILDADSHLYNAGQRPIFEDTWNLQHFSPNSDDQHTPDYNFIMSHWEWSERTAKAHRTGHFNRWTGERCHCGWGGHGKTLRQLRESRIVTSDDLHMRKLRKAPDKAFQTEQGQKFLAHLGEPRYDDYDSLRPYLAHRFKQGDIRLNENATGPSRWSWNDETGRREEHPGDPLPPRLEFLNRHGPFELYHSFDEPGELATPGWQALDGLPRWHQWYEGRQHPLRRGVNVMDKGFDPDTLNIRAMQHARAVQEAQKKANWLEQYARGYYASQPLHVFGPEAGPYKGWQVHKLDEHQAEGDSEALGHCIGQDDQPYKGAIGRGDIDAYSLRDKDGYPKVSWHINPSGDSIGHMQGRSGDPKPEYRDLISKFNEHHGLPDNETYEEEIPGGEDDYFTFPEAQDVEDYMRWHGPEPDYDYAYENGNIGENTQLEWSEPDFRSIARDYLHNGGAPYLPDGDMDDFHRTLRDNNHESYLAREMERQHDLSDENHIQALHQWNNLIRDGQHTIDVPDPHVNEVDKYNEEMDARGNVEPDDWDALAQDYLEYPQHYGPYLRRQDVPTGTPNGYDPYHDPTNPDAPNPRGRGEPGFLQRPTEYDNFHRHLRDNWHHDQMAEALKRNVDWEDPDHQLAIDSWNQGMPKQNIHPPAPEPEQPMPGQMQWNWPVQWQWPQNERASDPRPRTMEESKGFNDWWDWNAPPQYQVSNDSQYIPHASAVRVAEYSGWRNWETWNTKLMMDNDQPLYNASRQIVRQGGGPQQIEQWAIRAIIGPHNQQAIQDAKEWNSIPQEERLDHNWEDLNEKSPQAADLVNQLGFGPDVSDDEPDLIDPNVVDWYEIYRHLYEELVEENEYNQQLGQQTQQLPEMQSNPEDQPGDTYVPQSWTARTRHRAGPTMPWGQDWEEWNEQKPAYDASGDQLGYDPTQHAEGKGFLLDDGSVWTWPTQAMRPQHMEYAMHVKRNGQRVVPGSAFYIQNGLVGQTPGIGRSLSPEQQAQITTADPRLGFPQTPPPPSVPGYGHGRSVMDILREKGKLSAWQWGSTDGSWEGLAESPPPRTARSPGRIPLSTPARSHIARAGSHEPVRATALDSSRWDELGEPRSDAPGALDRDREATRSSSRDAPTLSHRGSPLARDTQPSALPWPAVAALHPNPSAQHSKDDAVPFGRRSSELSPVTELREWLTDLGGEDEPLSIHHDSPGDFVVEAPSTARTGLPYIPPSEASHYTQKGSNRRVADSPITQADATDDPLGKAPALEPSRSGDPDYLKSEICPHCLQRHRPDQPCGESSVTQYRQQERAWANRDPNAIHSP